MMQPLPQSLQLIGLYELSNISFLLIWDSYCKRGESSGKQQLQQ